MIILPRRRFLAGLGSALAAPAIVRASSLMPVRAYEAGEWMPEVIFPGEAVPHSATGHYTKIGKTIHFTIDLAFDAPGVASLTVTGLPFT